MFLENGVLAVRVLWDHLGLALTGLCRLSGWARFLFIFIERKLAVEEGMSWSVGLTGRGGRQVDTVFALV